MAFGIAKTDSACRASGREVRAARIIKHLF